MNTIGIIGATGVVGTTLIDLFEQTKLPYKLKLYASNNSDGLEMKCKKETYIVEAVSSSIFKDLDYAFFCSTSEVSKKYVPIAIMYNCICIDNSAAFRMKKDIPLVIPEINFDTVKDSKLISNPNCSTILLLMILYPLHQKYKIKSVHVSTYQAASGAGAKGVTELISQTDAFVNSKQLDTSFFGRQYLFNAFSHNSNIDPLTKLNEEELKMIKEVHKIIDPTIKVYPTCIRIPTIRSHLETVHLEFEEEVKTSEIKSTLEEFKGVKILDDVENNIFPEPLISAKKEDVYVGRFVPDYYGDKHKHQLILSGDQVLKGAALNAFQIYKEMTKE